MVPEGRAPTIGATRMVNLDDPKEFFRVIVEPNLWEFYAKEEDLRLGVNSILTLDALALLWQIYSRRCSLQIHFRQCGHRCGGS